MITRRGQKKTSNCIFFILWSNKCTRVKFIDNSRFLEEILSLLFATVSVNKCSAKNVPVVLFSLCGFSQAISVLIDHRVKTLHFDTLTCRLSTCRNLPQIGGDLVWCKFYENMKFCNLNKFFTFLAIKQTKYIAYMCSWGSGLNLCNISCPKNGKIELLNLLFNFVYELYELSERSWLTWYYRIKSATER